MNFTPETNNLNAYLQSDDIIDWNNPGIIKAAAEITTGLMSDVDKARALFEWVRDTIPHTVDAGREEITCVASQVLSLGTGFCYSKAHLFAAMLRASNIPAGFCYQMFKEELPGGEYQMPLHGLNGIYLWSLDRWILLDPRGNIGGIDAQFSTENEKLAFPDMEFLDGCIYASPLPQVLKALKTWPTRDLLLSNLPTSNEL